MKQRSEGPLRRRCRIHRSVRHPAATNSASSPSDANRVWDTGRKLGDGFRFDLASRGIFQTVKEIVDLA
jgi:hypothetical protein